MLLSGFDLLLVPLFLMFSNRSSDLEITFLIDGSLRSLVAMAKFTVAFRL